MNNNEINNLVASIDVKGKQEFMGKEIPVIEGGFGEGQKVVLAKTIAEIHEVKTDKINDLINNHIDEFEDGIDILSLKGNKEFETLAKGNGLYTQNSLNSSKYIYLLSEQGYMLLVGFMKTEKAKAIRKQLRREYFAMRKVLNSSEQLKSNLLLEIYNGGQNGVLASKKLTELETRSLQDTIEKQSNTINELLPAANYTKKVLEDNDTLLTITQIAKDFGMSGQALNDLLHDLGVQYKQNGQWLLYSKYQGKGYARTVQSEIKNAKPQTKWTQKGKKFINDTLRKKGIKTIWEQEQEVLQVQQTFDLN